MNDLAQALLQGGRGTRDAPLKGVFYRQFLSASKVCVFVTLATFQPPNF